jgi:hypothetical protein
MLCAHCVTKCHIWHKYTHLHKANKNSNYARIRVILSKAYFRQEASCLLQPFCSMELNLKVRKFLLSSIYVTAAICGHMMTLVWSIKLIWNTAQKYYALSGHITEVCSYSQNGSLHQLLYPVVPLSLSSTLLVFTSLVLEIECIWFKITLKIWQMQNHDRTSMACNENFTMETKIISTNFLMLLI